MEANKAFKEFFYMIVLPFLFATVLGIIFWFILRSRFEKEDNKDIELEKQLYSNSSFSQSIETEPTKSSSPQADDTFLNKDFADNQSKTSFTPYYRRTLNTFVANNYDFNMKNANLDFDSATLTSESLSPKVGRISTLDPKQMYNMLVPSFTNPTYLIQEEGMKITDIYEQNRQLRKKLLNKSLDIFTYPKRLSIDSPLNRKRANAMVSEESSITGMSDSESFIKGILPMILLADKEQLEKEKEKKLEEEKVKEKEKEKDIPNETIVVNKPTKSRGSIELFTDISLRH